MPYDTQAELGVLGSLLLLPSTFDEVSGIVDHSDFYDPAHYVIFKAMARLIAERTLDPALLMDELRANGTFETAGGAAYIAQIVNSVPNAAHANYYAEIVAQKSIARKVIAQATSLLTAAYDERTEKDDLVSRVHEVVNVINASDRSPSAIRTMRSFAGEVMDELEQQRQVGGVNRAFFGLSTVDEALGPIMPGEICIIAARPGMGKTSFAHGIIRNSANHGRPALLVSLEMRGQELATRELCSITGVDSRDVRSGNVEVDDLHNMRHAQQEMREDNQFLIWAPPIANFNAIRANVKKSVAEQGVACAAIDFFTMIQISGGSKMESRREKYVELSHQLKSLARECSIPLFILAQLNREAENVEPTKAMLRETGALEEDADCILFLHQEGTDQRRKKLIAAKFRGANTGKLELQWDGRRTMFSDIPGPEQNQQLSDWNN